MRLETERLFLREMTREDFDALYVVLGDSDVMQHYPYTFDEGAQVDREKSGALPHPRLRSVGGLPEEDG